MKKTATTSSGAKTITMKQPDDGEQAHATEDSASQLRLHADEALQHQQDEAVIERGIATFYEVGEALLRIRDRRSYRATHDTFEAYCSERWSIKKSQAYRLIDAAHVAENLSPIGDKPLHESQIRPLVALSPEDQRTVWEQAVEESEGKPPTALKVSELSKMVRDRIVERRREADAEVVESPAKSSDDNLQPMSRQEFREWREECRVNDKRNSQVWDFIEAIEKLAKPALPLDEAAAAILAMNGPDVDWPGQSDEALRNFQILVRELHLPGGTHEVAEGAHAGLSTLGESIFDRRGSRENVAAPEVRL